MRHFTSILLSAILVNCRATIPNSPEAMEDTSDLAGTVPFIQIQGVETVLKIRIDESTDLNPGSERCGLDKNQRYDLTQQPQFAPDGKHLKVSLAKKIPGCEFTVGLVFAEHVKSSLPTSPYCQFSWDERPGTTDYTTRDQFHGGRYFPKPDRSQELTLIGKRRKREHMDLCEKARELKHCFEKAILSSNEYSATRFKNWAKSHNINPVLALMAKAEKETAMGVLEDSCSGRNCNGIGIGQIITAVDENGTRISDFDKRWEGITFNILTNLKYSVRVVAMKLGMSASLRDLAYYYNGDPRYQTQYASDVVANYAALQRCKL